MPEPKPNDELPKVEFPSAEALSYRGEDVEMSRLPIDWELTKPELWESMSAEERENVLREQHRRIYYGMRDLARILDKFAPREDGKTVYERLNIVLNPDQYSATFEQPQVEPSDSE